EPALPSLSYLALREAESLTVATFLSAERLAYPPARAQRERLLGRVDVLLATSEETASAAALRFPGDYRIVSEGGDTAPFGAAPPPLSAPAAGRVADRASCRVGRAPGRRGPPLPRARCPGRRRPPAAAGRRLGCGGGAGPLRPAPHPGPFKRQAPRFTILPCL